MKKNVWIINHYASDTYFDEGGRHYWFAQYLREKEYNPIIFSANSIHGKYGLYFQEDKLYSEHISEKINVPYVFVRARAYEGNGKQRILNMVDFYLNAKIAIKKYSVEKKVKPDIIIASSVHPLAILAGIEIAKYFKVKCICEIRDLWPESLIAYGILNKNSIFAKMLYAGEKYLYRHSDKIIMTWQGGYDYIKDRGWNIDIPAEKVVHISNGIDLKSFEQNKLNNYLDEKEIEKKVYIYTGSIRKVNNVGMLVEAAKILSTLKSDILILIYGDGDEKEQLQCKIDEMGLDNIKLMGRVKKEQIPYIISHSYATILHNSSTSLDKYGQSQNKFFEYLAAGRPILMTYSVGHSVVRENNCGLELDAQAPSQIAEAMIKLSNLSEKDYKKMCLNAKQLSVEYDFKNLTDKLICIIENI